ncbi:hypothetical protein CfE428DRAFT_5363 [Chthoniobacter flavus Ellin428]|uniref:Uncharacterized protein n=1 Tax=Chthoniobacter flavus Ellin428 TaxID=497964 RepID=B4D8X3_9BACT|nr:hypothetical protein [Chthoniobacter flavus]EDY17181.1 hypothetical protein CfE428DRAFT_5363 [Chthoniobacter flavus Ellin428]
MQELLDLLRSIQLTGLQCTPDHFGDLLHPAEHGLQLGGVAAGHGAREFLGLRGHALEAPV